MHWYEGFFDWSVDFPKDEENHYCETADYGGEDCSGFPGVEIAAPREAKEEGDEAGAEEEGAYVIEVLSNQSAKYPEKYVGLGLTYFDPVHLAINIVLVFLVEARWEIE